MSSLSEEFKIYIEALQSSSLSDITEHTHRTQLENLLNAIKNASNTKIKILHEPKRLKEFGAPDFKVSFADSIIGYVENKSIEENLDKILKSDQIRRYRELSKNIILTNYIEWIWIKDDNIVRENLCFLTDLENKKFKLDENKVNAVVKLVKNFLSYPPEKIGKPKELANALAVRTKNLKDFLYEELQEQIKEDRQGTLCGIYKVFQSTIFSELTLEEFSDTFAQTLSYGLFLAKLNAGSEKVSLENIKRLIPQSFHLIRELVKYLDEIENPDTKWIIEEIISIINNIELDELIRNLSFSRSSTYRDIDIPIKDPYVHFYEDFLRIYDKETKIDRGVFYTPLPVVKFIINGINEILENEFDIKEGFLDRKNVTMLDFATGTGTFILEVLELIFSKIKGSGAKDLLIKEHILKNFYGFEYLIAPYTIAHLKLAQYLKNIGYQMQNDESFQIFLTNTLEYSKDIQHNAIVPAIVEEGEKALKIKEKPILVITGNPPYNVKSKNKSDWILDLIENYKPTDEKKLNLDDDYIKFIRFAHNKMEQVENGVIGVITNNSFLNGLTHRKMRNELLKEFSKIYIVNLHGNLNIKEATPDGQPDENVFDIRQGVCITFFVKNKNEKNNCKVLYYDLFGKKEDKFKFLYKNELNDIKFEKLEIEKFNNDFRLTKWGKERFIDDLSFFIPMSNSKTIFEYGEFWGITEIFDINGCGVKTDRDELVIDFGRNSLIEKLKKAFSNNFDETFAKKYHILNSSSYPFKDKLIQQEFEPKNIYSILYRPFDERKIYYKVGFTSRPAYETMKHISDKDNLGLIFKRQFKNELGFSYIFISNKMADCCLFESAYANNNLTPLYLYETEDEFKERVNKGKYQLGLFEAQEEYVPKKENLKPEFRGFINQKYNKVYTPEQILGYIYGVMHSQTYREKYLEFLKIDFPRVPFTDDKSLFEEISKLGWDLIQKHLMNEIPEIEIGKYKKEENNENHEVLKPELLKDKLYINKTQYFENVSEEIYNCQIGGYQVLDKYLSARKGRTLELDEIENVEKVIKIIAYTIGQMKKIDEITKGWI